MYQLNFYEIEQVQKHIELVKLDVYKNKAILVVIKNLGDEKTSCFPGHCCNIEIYKIT